VAAEEQLFYHFHFLNRLEVEKKMLTHGTIVLTLSFMTIKTILFKV